MASPFKIVKGAGKAIERSAEKAAAKEAATVAKKAAKKAKPTLEELQAAGTVPTPGGSDAEARAALKKQSETAGTFDPYAPRSPAAGPAPTKTTPKGDKPKPKKQAITNTDLRHLPPEQAIKIAKKGEHIIPKPEGGFVGAPAQAQSMRDVRRLRRQFDQDVGLGGGGADWYKRTHDWIEAVAGPDPAKQSELARGLALFSAQADPDTNLGFYLQAHNAAITGNPRDKVRTGAQATEYNRAFDAAKEAEAEGIDLMDPEARKRIGHNRLRYAPWEIGLGKKTGIFGEHMDPTRENPTTGTNDIWHARALGYTNVTGKPWDKALTAQQHAWMDAETVLAVDRANKAKLGGRDNWTPGEIQAAPWVYRKALGLQQRFPNKYPDLDTSLNEARKTYPEYADKYTAGGTHEVVPGKSTSIEGGPQHLPEYSDPTNRAMRDEYSSDPRYWWSGGDNDPADVLYRAQNVQTAPTVPGTGIYNGEVNINNTARPMLSFAGAGKNKTMDDASKQILQGTEAFRSFVNAQDAGAGSMFLGGVPVSRQNAYNITLPGSSEADVLQAKELAREHGMGDLIHHGGTKAIATTFGDAGATLGENVGAKAAKRVNQAFGDIGGAATAGRVEGPYIGHDWSKPGEGVASAGMLENLQPFQMDAFANPEVRNIVERIQAADAEKAAAGSQVRPDIQNSRALLAQAGPGVLRSAVEILQSQGKSGLADAIKKGLLGAGLTLPFVGAGLAGERDDQSR